MAYLSKNQQREALLRALERFKAKQQFVKDCMMIPPPPVISQEVKQLIKQVYKN